MKKLLALLCFSFCIQAFSTELITNGTFNSSLAGWTKNDVAGWNDGAALSSPNGGVAFFSNFGNPSDPANPGVSSISQLINITSSGNYNLSFDFGFQTGNGYSAYTSNTNTLSILFGGSQIGSIQLIQNGVSYPGGVSVGTSTDIVKGSSSSTVSIASGISNWRYQSSYSVTSTAGIKTLQFLYDFKDTIFIIDNISLISLGASAADTQSSMQYQASQLRSAFNTQTVAANFALNYDCNVFDVKGMCISAGGRYTTIDNPNINNSAAFVTLGYKVNPNIRVGAYLDQNINISNPTGIDISNNTPLMGLYAVWNKEQSGLGYQVRLANTYQDKDVTQTRTVFNTSEAGSGKSSLQSQSYLAELSYAFQYQDKTLVRPYAGLRYTHLRLKGYTEDATDTVTDPLTLAALRDKGTTALLGLKINRSLTDKATLTAQLGLEQDVHHKVDQYSATDLNGSELTAIAFNSNIKRTRPVASLGAFYDVTKTQRASATINYQQTPFHSTGSTTAYFNYMIGF